MEKIARIQDVVVDNPNEEVMKKLKKIMRYNKYSYEKWINRPVDFDRKFEKRYHRRAFAYIEANLLLISLTNELWGVKERIFNGKENYEFKAINNPMNKRRFLHLAELGYTDLALSFFVLKSFLLMKGGMQMSKDKIYDTLEKVLIFAIGATAIVLMLIVVKDYLQSASQQEIIWYFTKMIWKIPMCIFLLKKIRDL